MSSPAKESLLELQDFSKSRTADSGARKSSHHSASAATATDEEDPSDSDVPASVSVLPLLSGAASSSDAHYLYSSAVSNSSAVRGQSEQKESGGGGGGGGGSSWRARGSSSPSANEHDALSPAVPHGPIVVCNNIHKTYLLGLEGVPALRGVSLSIDRGEFIMILGSSGGGQ